jgi:hypothetical protein
MDEYQTAVERIRKHLSSWLESGIELFLELQSVENSGVWRTLHPTFGDFLTREFPNALGLNRYENVVKAIAIYGIDRAKLVGVEGCHAMLTAEVVRDERKRTELEASIDRHMLLTGTPPPAQELRRMVRGILGTPSAVAKATAAVRRDVAAQSELERLRAELNAAQKRIRSLESELRKLKGQEERSAS